MPRRGEPAFVFCLGSRGAFHPPRPLRSCQEPAAVQLGGTASGLHPDATGSQPTPERSILEHPAREARRFHVLTWRSGAKSGGSTTCRRRRARSRGVPITAPCRPSAPTAPAVTLAQPPSTPRLRRQWLHRDVFLFFCLALKRHVFL